MPNINEKLNYNFMFQYIIVLCSNLANQDQRTANHLIKGYQLRATLAINKSNPLLLAAVNDCQELYRVPDSKDINHWNISVRSSMLIKNAMSAKIKISNAKGGKEKVG